MDWGFFGGAPRGLASSTPGSSGNPGGLQYNGSFNSGTGTVFRVTTNGILTTLVYFADPLNGLQPNGQLAQTTNGDLFGMTR